MSDFTPDRVPLTDTEISSITMLIERAREGSDEARAKVIRRLQPFVIAMAAQHNEFSFQNKHGVSDIVQQSFVKVIENFQSFRGTSSAEFRAWLKQLVINEVRQITRRLHQQRRDVKRERPLNTGEAHPHAQVSVEEPNPEAHAVLQEQLSRLRSVMDELNNGQRQIVELRAFENLSFREIAKRTGRSQDAVTKTWYRSLILLQKRLGGDE